MKADGTSELIDIFDETTPPCSHVWMVSEWEIERFLHKANQVICQKCLIVKKI